MFDLSKWENDHPAIQRFARQVADVLESLADHLIGQASAAVADALGGHAPAAPQGFTAPQAAIAAANRADGLSGPYSVLLSQGDQSAGNGPQAPVQPAPDPVPADVDAAGSAFVAKLARAQQLVGAGATPEEAAAAVGLSLRATLTTGDPTTASDLDPATIASLTSADGAAPAGDSGPAGVVAGAGQDVPVTGAPVAAGVPGADLPVTHNVDPADVVGADSHNAAGQ